LDGKIEASNEKFYFKDKGYMGAKLSVILSKQ